MVLVTSADGAVDNVSVSILVLHSDYTIRYANPAAHRLLGYRPGTLAGGALAELVPVEGRPLLDRVESVLLNEGGCKFQSQVTRADGRPLDVLFAIEPALHSNELSTDLMVSLTPVPPWGLPDSEASPLRKLEAHEALIQDEHEALIQDEPPHTR